jgi:hypothetical protein
MRKTVTVLIIVMFWFSSNNIFAQDEAGLGGGISVELNCDLFVVDQLSITPTFLKARYFINNDIAVRLSTWFDFSSDQKVPESTLNYSYFTVRPGAEYHVSTHAGFYTAYVGAEAIINYADFNFDTKVGVPVTGAWNTSDIQNFYNRGYLTLGGTAFAGAELYKGSVFFGTEIGLAYLYTSHAEVLLGNDLFLGQSKSAMFGIDLSRIVRVGVMIPGGSSPKM